MTTWTDVAPFRLDTLQPASTGYVPSIVAAGLNRCWAACDEAGEWPARSDTEHAVRAERLAVLAGRAARWWRVLGAWVYSPAGRPLPLVFGAAALRAADD